MLKSECYVGQTVHFTCNGRGRGGHFHVTAIVSSVNRVNAVLIEAERSYRPGTRWSVPIKELRTAEQDRDRSAEMVAELRAAYPHLFERL